MNEPIDFSPQGINEIIYKLNLMGVENLLLKNIIISNTPTTYEVIDAILGERTDPQYCIHTIGDFIPSSFSDFTNEDFSLQQYEKINLNPNNRIGTKFIINSLDNGSHIYFLTKANLDFFSNGFKGGFSEIENTINNATDYRLYRSNQRLSRRIEIQTEKKSEEGGNN